MADEPLPLVDRIPTVIDDPGGNPDQKLVLPPLSPEDIAELEALEGGK